MHFPYIPDVTGAPDALSAHPTRLRSVTNSNTAQLPIRLDDPMGPGPHRSSRSREHSL